MAIRQRDVSTVTRWTHQFLTPVLRTSRSTTNSDLFLFKQGKQWVEEDKDELMGGSLLVAVVLGDEALHVLEDDLALVIAV